MGDFACVMTQAVLAKVVFGTPGECAIDRENMFVLFERTNYNIVRRDDYGLYDVKRSQ